MPTQFEPHTWDQLCAQNAQVNNKFETVVFHWNYMKTNGKFIFPHDIKWSDRNHSFVYKFAGICSLYKHKFYEPKGKTDGDGENWRKTKKIEKKKKNDHRQPIFGYGDCFVANGLMLVCFVFNFVAFKIDMKVHVCKMQTILSNPNTSYSNIEHWTVNGVHVSANELTAQNTTQLNNKTLNKIPHDHRPFFFQISLAKVVGYRLFCIRLTFRKRCSINSLNCLAIPNSNLCSMIHLNFAQCNRAHWPYCVLCIMLHFIRVYHTWMPK